jgi:hypothetical protein
VITLALAVIAFLALKTSAPAAAAPAPAPAAAPGAFKAMFLAAAAAVDLKGIAVALLWPIAYLETANGTNSVSKTNNPFSIHAAYWSGPTFTTERGEVLRVYQTLADGIADGIREISTSKHYQTAYAYATANLPAQFYPALAKGDAGDGWVGTDPAKQQAYADALMRIYTTGG